VKRNNGNTREINDSARSLDAVQASGDLRSSRWRLPGTGQLLAEFAFAGGGSLIARRLMGSLNSPARSRGGMLGLEGGQRQRGMER
jgi:hypothetical protein